MPERPSKKQSEVLDAIHSFIEQNGFGPSYRELQRHLGYKSVSTIAAHVDGLVAKGLLHKQENAARSLQFVPTSIESEQATPSESHLEWLRKEIAEREADDTLSKEAAILKAALTVLDQEKS